MTTHHLQTKIQTLLDWSDNELQEVFGGFGPDIRKELQDRKDSGEILIGSVDCIEFDPITGCPGHEVQEVTNG